MLAKSAKIPQTLYIKITSYKIDLNFDSFYRRIFLSGFSAPLVDLHCTFGCRIANITFPYFWQTWATPPPHLRADSANIGEFWRIFHQSCWTPSTWRSSFLRHTYSIHNDFSLIFNCYSVFSCLYCLIAFFESHGFEILPPFFTNLLLFLPYQTILKDTLRFVLYGRIAVMSGSAWIRIILEGRSGYRLEWKDRSGSGSAIKLKIQEL